MYAAEGGAAEPGSENIHHFVRSRNGSSERDRLFSTGGTDVVIAHVVPGQDYLRDRAPHVVEELLGDDALEDAELNGIAKAPQRLVELSAAFIIGDVICNDDEHGQGHRSEVRGRRSATSNGLLHSAEKAFCFGAGGFYSARGLAAMPGGELDYSLGDDLGQ